MRADRRGWLRTARWLLLILLLSPAWTPALLASGPAVETETPEQGQVSSEAIEGEGEDSRRIVPLPEPRRRVVRQTGQFTFGGDTIRVEPNHRVDGNVVAIFSDIVIEGEVDGQVVAIWGNVEVAGEVRNDVVSVLSDSVLEPGAEIGGQMINVAGALLNRGAVIEGGQIDLPLGFDMDLGGPLAAVALLAAWIRLIKLLLFFVVILLFAALIPDRLRVMSREAPVRYFPALLAGVGAYLLLSVLNTTLLATVFGIPIAVALYVAFVVLKWLGIAAILHRLGERVGLSIGREMSLLGAILLGFIPYALLVVVPSFLGVLGFVFSWALWLAFWLLLEAPAIGLVILTGAGSPRAERPPEVPAAVIAPEPQVPPSAEGAPEPGPSSP